MLGVSLLIVFVAVVGYFTEAFPWALRPVMLE
jgi:hypothetical protein